MPNLFPCLQPHVLVCQYGIYHLCSTFTLQFLYFFNFNFYFYFFFWRNIQSKEKICATSWAGLEPHPHWSPL